MKVKERGNVKGNNKGDESEKKMRREEEERKWKRNDEYTNKFLKRLKRLRKGSERHPKGNVYRPVCREESNNIKDLTFLLRQLKLMQRIFDM